MPINPYIGGFSDCPLIKDDYERLCCELEELKKAGQIVVKATGSEKSNTAHHWTVLKLVFLKMYVRDVYTPIIGKRYPVMIFIDLFGGRGLNTYRDAAYRNAQFHIPGSSLIAWFYATYPFDKIFSIGYDKPYNQPEYYWLKRRLTRFIPRDRLEIFVGDVNKKIDNIVEGLLDLRDKVKEQFNKGLHYLAFIDPNSHEVHWETIKKLIELEREGIVGDLIILLQARLIARIMGNIRSNPEKNPKVQKDLDLFFGTEQWRDFLNSNKSLEESILDLYINNLADLKQRALIERIDIELMKENIHYYLIYVTRVTNQGSPYLSTVIWLKNFVEKVDKRTVIDNAIKEVLGIIKKIRITDFTTMQ